MSNDSSVLKSILKDSLVRPEENGMGGIVPLSETEKQILNKLWSNLVVKVRKMYTRYLLRCLG